MCSLRSAAGVSVPRISAPRHKKASVRWTDAEYRGHAIHPTTRPPSRPAVKQTRRIIDHEETASSPDSPARRYSSSSEDFSGFRFLSGLPSYSSSSEDSPGFRFRFDSHFMQLSVDVRLVASVRLPVPTLLHICACSSPFYPQILFVVGFKSPDSSLHRLDSPSLLPLCT